MTGHVLRPLPRILSRLLDEDGEVGYARMTPMTGTPRESCLATSNVGNVKIDGRLRWNWEDDKLKIILPNGMLSRYLEQSA